MTYNRNQAKPLLSADEYMLFTDSLSDRIGDLDQAQLRAAITRARTARDKYRDLAVRQNIAVSKVARARGAAHGSNDRTDAKATVWTEALARFEKRLEGMRTPDIRPDPKTDSGDSSAATDQRPTLNRAERRAAASGSGPARGAFMSASAEAESNKRLNGPTAKSISAHRSAVGRRNQAKRDSR